MTDNETTDLEAISKALENLQTQLAATFEEALAPIFDIMQGFEVYRHPDESRQRFKERGGRRW